MMFSANVPKKLAEVSLKKQNGVRPSDSSKESSPVVTSFISNSNLTRETWQNRCGSGRCVIAGKSRHLPRSQLELEMAQLDGWTDSKIFKSRICLCSSSVCLPPLLFRLSQILSERFQWPPAAELSTPQSLCVN